MGGNEISATGVSPKWVESNRCRGEREERRAKVNDYNGQYLSPEPKYFSLIPAQFPSAR